MSRLVVAPIVEGHGEQQSAARTILTRIWHELVGGEYIDVLSPIRRPRSKLIQAAELGRAIEFAKLKLAERHSDDPKLVLVLIDADDDLPCVLGPQIAATARTLHGDIDVAVVIANVEFETWFVAAAESLESYFDLSAAEISEQPERERRGKGTVVKWMHGRYTETADQARLSAKLNLDTCRRRSPSFDKLCRELEARAGG